MNNRSKLTTGLFAVLAAVAAVANYAAPALFAAVDSPFFTG